MRSGRVVAVLLAAVALTAAGGAGLLSSRVPAAVVAVAPASATPRAEQPVRPAALLRVEAAVRAAVRADGADPAAIRRRLVSAGFPESGIETTAAVTTIGAAMPVVEAAVRRGGACLVAEVDTRTLAVRADEVPPIDGRCLLGAG